MIGETKLKDIKERLRELLMKQPAALDDVHENGGADPVVVALRRLVSAQPDVRSEKKRPLKASTKRPRPKNKTTRRQ